MFSIAVDLSSLLICNFIFLLFMFTSMLSNIKQANFHSVSLLADPSSNLKFVNHAVPVQSPSYPPKRNPIFTLLLFFELNTNSSFCQSFVPSNCF